MPLRNMWSLEPGEVLVAEEILNKVPGYEIYFPLRDVGVDLLVVRGGRCCGIQVKESRYYVTKKWHNSWHHVSARDLDLETSPKKKAPDFFVFLTYVPDYEGTRITSFRHRYIIVPFQDLETKAKGKKVSAGSYSFCFSFEDKIVTDIREDSIDYTRFLENWSLIDLTS